MRLRPAGVIVRLVVAAASAEAVTPDAGRVPVTSRNAEIARSIADRCCSSSEMILSISFKEAPENVMLSLTRRISHDF